MKRFTGEIFWMKLEGVSKDIQGYSEAKIKRAILHEKIFKIDHTNPDNLPDSEIRLKSNDGLKYDGSAKYFNSAKSNALVNMEHYWNGKNAIMTGTWEEDQIEYMCIIRLTEVDKFKD